MNSNIKNIIKQNELFSFLDIEKINKEKNFIDKLVIRDYPKGQIIHFQDEICLALDIIVEGKVSIQNIDINGNILTIKIFGNNEITGANLLFSKRNRYPMMVEALEKTRILHIPKETIVELSHNNKNFMLKFMQILSDRSTILTDKITEISFKSLREKINYYLLSEMKLQDSNQIKLNVSKKELAEKMGVQRTSLSRELKKMKLENYIDYNNKVITVLKKLESE